jgi:hypothetical protein
MIRVTVDIVPFGDESYRRGIGEILLANDGKGDQEWGDYEYVRRTDEGIRVGRIESHQRRLGWDVLVKRILEDEGTVGIMPDTLQDRLFKRMLDLPYGGGDYVYNIGFEKLTGEREHTPLRHHKRFGKLQLEDMVIECAALAALQIADERSSDGITREWAPTYAHLHEDILNHLIEKYGFRRLVFENETCFDGWEHLMVGQVSPDATDLTKRLSKAVQERVAPAPKRKPKTKKEAPAKCTTTSKPGRKKKS